VLVSVLGSEEEGEGDGGDLGTGTLLLRAVVSDGVFEDGLELGGPGVG
jgi:hypothetical protein